MAFTKRGLRLVEALGKYARDKPNYFDTGNVLNKITFTAANDEKIKAVMTVDDSMCNGYEIMHGGYISLVMDFMCVYGHIAQNGGKLAMTTNFNVNFMERVNIGEKVTAEAITVRGGATPIMESKLYKENGSIIAQGTASFVDVSEKYQLLGPRIFGFDILKSD